MDGYLHGGFPMPSDRIDTAVEPRRNRDSLFLLARVRIADAGDWSEVRVRNLSAGGLMAEIAVAMPIDTPVELELRGIGKVGGRVAWQAEGRTGVAFDSQVDPLKARKPVGKPRTTPIRG